ncbi:MAG: tetratricopeptide repeat protein [Candidatus Eisenbacteria bacterium]|nr:tetratricopeptide repeat protein [Candidatus Eisenbacteria bacterium]
MSAGRIRRTLRAARVAVIGLCLVAGCAPKHGTAAPDPAARAGMLIEAGNQAYRAGDFRLAARRYAAAAVNRPEEPAAFYGLGMALSKLGRDEDARAAYAKARELAHQQQP